MKKSPILAICTLSLFSFATSVQANTISYDYMDVGYSFVNDSVVSGGVILSGSYDIYDNVNVLGNLFISTSSDKPAPKDAELTSYTIGFGYHQNISEKMDVFAEALLLNTDVTVGSLNKDDTGYIAAVGVRSPLNENVELLGRIERRNSDALSETVFTFGGLYKYSEKTFLGLKLNTGAGDGSEALTASVRWNF
ncbi:MAG: hypothetical protein KAG34_10400 [Cocleimonas sp.]|nr:hypothetical protein [Cocleimonas sp.]